MRRVHLACILVVVAAVVPSPFAGPTSAFTLTPRWVGEDEIALWWERPDGAEGFQVDLDGQPIARTPRTNQSIVGAAAGRQKISVTALNAVGDVVAKSRTLEIVRPAASPRVSVLDHGADPNGGSLCTAAVQRAIAACPRGGTVVFPRGTYLTGALFLKSDLTLLLEGGAVLRGSEDPGDYPLVSSRFEGWETETFASLINGGQLSHDEVYAIARVAIHGRGRIVGGGTRLAEAMVAQRGRRSRGRLISISNGEDIDIAGITCEGSPSWTLHFIYSQRVTCRDLVVNSTVRNGDGIDPDSCRQVWIYNCRFDTGDDCIAIKSGKNPEGVVIGRPTEEVWITDCVFAAGHGISVGSEVSGGVRKVRVLDCEAGPLKYGLQIKATPERGGYVQDVVVARCRLGKIRVLTRLPYNNDGEPAPTLPIFRDFVFRELDLRDGAVDEPVIQIDGFEGDGHATRDVVLRDLQLPEGGRVQLSRCEAVQINRVRTKSGAAVPYAITDSHNLTIDHDSP